METEIELRLPITNEKQENYQIFKMLIDGEYIKAVKRASKSPKKLTQLIKNITKDRGFQERLECHEFVNDELVISFIAGSGGEEMMTNLTHLFGNMFGAAVGECSDDYNQYLYEFKSGVLLKDGEPYGGAIVESEVATRGDGAILIDGLKMKSKEGFYSYLLPALGFAGSYSDPDQAIVDALRGKSTFFESDKQETIIWKNSERFKTLVRENHRALIEEYEQKLNNSSKVGSKLTKKAKEKMELELKKERKELTYDTIFNDLVCNLTWSGHNLIFE
jgi:hypothetical protein